MVYARVEIVKSSLTAWFGVAPIGCTCPPFGSLVVVASSAMRYYGIVSDISIQSADEVYVPVPMGLSQEELHRAHPQAAVHTQVMVSLLALGYSSTTDGIVYQWPPLPPPLHSPIDSADDILYARFLQTHEYIAMIMRLPALADCQVEELLLALLRHVVARGLLMRDGIEPWIAALAPWFMQDYVRFRQFLARAERIVYSLISPQGDLQSLQAGV